VVPRRRVVGVIDDDNAVLEALHDLLSARGYQTELYASAEQFVATALNSKAACLVVDVQLGDFSGIELCRHLHATGLTFPVIFVTGSRDPAVQQQAMDFGCVAYLHKPFAADQLIKAITRAIGFGLLALEQNLENADPLLTLLRRYQAQRRAFDDAPTRETSDHDWEGMAQPTWYATQHEIIKLEPPATTAAGAISALDHVLQSDELFGERSESADLRMLWLLVKAARDFVAAAHPQHVRESGNDR